MYGRVRYRCIRMTAVHTGEHIRLPYVDAACVYGCLTYRYMHVAA